MTGRRWRGRGLRLLASAVVMVFGVALTLSLSSSLAPVPASRAASRSVPPGLVRAIHAVLGPRPVGLGRSPLVAGITPAGAGWEVRSRSSSVEALISSSGTVSAGLAGRSRVSIVPRDLVSGGARVGLSVRASSLDRGRLVQRLGALTASYHVTAGGLEQRFVIEHPLATRGSELALALSSSAFWRARRAGSAIVPVGGNEGALAYAGLRSTDAAGRVLRSRFVVAGNRIEIRVDAVGARYPVTIDPTWTTTSTPTATLTNAAGATGDRFGSDVALSADGTTAIVGAPFANNVVGAAYIFHASAEGSWSSSSTPVATLTDSTGAGGDTFGGDVALSADGTTALLAGGRGSLLVFHVSSEASWASSSTPTAILTNGANTNEFDGAGLSADGTTALVGAQKVNSGAGAAYVFHVSSEGSWSSSATPAATLTNGAGASGDNFGVTAALSADGTTALLGASGASSVRGAAYIFHVSSEGSWSSSSTPTATLTNNDGSAGDGLGTAVALSGDGNTALVGASGVDSLTGAAYMFHVASETSWSSSSTPTATLSNGDGSAGDQLGTAVALSRDGATAVVGASTLTGSNGAGYIFEAPSEASWGSSSTPTATLTNAAPSGLAGMTLSSDGTVALLGAPGVNSDTGAAYILDSEHALTVSVAGSGSGTVASAPAGIFCPSACSATYPHGTTVTLTATGAPGSVFAGWSGAGCSGTGACSVSITQDQAVTAIFDTVSPGQHTLTVTKSGSGSGTVTSSPAGIDCGQGCAATFTAGTSVKLTATPANGSLFVGWSGAGCSGTDACTVTMSSDQTVTAIFERRVPRLSALKLKPRAFRAATKGPTVGGRADTGTTIRFRATLDSKVTFRVLHCAGPHGHCRRLARAGTFSHRDHAGRNRLRFSGRVRGRALHAGHYILRASATLDRRTSRPVSASFTILARPAVCLDPDHDGDCDAPGQS